MVIALNDIQQRVERSLEDALYRAFLQLGYLPDRAAFANNRAGYDSAYSAIAAAKGFGVEVFGSGSPHDRKLKTTPRVVINSLGFSKGETGGLFEPNYINRGTHYDKVRESFLLSNYLVDIQLVSSTTTQDRVLEAVRQHVIPNLGYIPFIGNPRESFLIEQGYVRQVPDLVTGLLDKTYNYEIKDLVEQLPRLMGPIAKVKKITVRESDAVLFSHGALTIIQSDSQSMPESTDTILN